jgi:perosamine synthetase
MAQLERLDDYVQKRRDIWDIYAEAALTCDYLVPQKVPEYSKSACWTFAARYEGEDALGVSWETFAGKFNEFSNEGIYAAWSVAYLEPALQQQRFYGNGCPTRCPHYQGEIDWSPGLCPVAEAVQPKIMQLKSNFGTLEEADEQAEALRKTIDFFGR